MAKQAGIRWIKPPSHLQKAVRQYGDKALVAVYAVGANFGARLQNEARLKAIWHDRTGNARGGLFFAVDGFGLEPKEGELDPKKQPEFNQHRVDAVGPGGNKKTLVVVLGHTMSYGEHLELDHGGAYAIIMPTIEANIPVLEQMLQELFRD